MASRLDLSERVAQCYFQACRLRNTVGVSPQNKWKACRQTFIEILKKRDASDTILFRCQFSFRIHSGRFVIQFRDQSYRVQHEPKNARNLFIFIVYVISVIRKCVIFQEFCTPLNIKLKKGGGVISSFSQPLPGITTST